MSVAENVFISGEHAPVFATKSSLARKASPFLKEVGLEGVDPYIPVERLSVGEQQLVEVARLLAQQPQILILDEPTAALGESDSIRILAMVQRLAQHQFHQGGNIKLFCSARFLALTVAQDGNPITNFEDFIHSVADVDNRLTALGQPLNHRKNTNGIAFSQRRRWLI